MAFGQFVFTFLGQPTELVLPRLSPSSQAPAPSWSSSSRNRDYDFSRRSPGKRPASIYDFRKVCRLPPPCILSNRTHIGLRVSCVRTLCVRQWTTVALGAGS